MGAFYNFIELHFNLYLSKFKHICVNWRRNIILLSYTVACVYLYKSNVPLILEIKTHLKTHLQSCFHFISGFLNMLKVYALNSESKSRKYKFCLL